MSWLDEKEGERFFQLSSLAHSLFVQNEEGKIFLNLLREAFFFTETASPNKESSHAYYREGEKNMIRRLSYWADAYPKLMKEKNTIIEETEETEETEEKNHE